MHLENASSGSQEAGVVGWISSNDVTLFTVVLVLVIAIFLQVSLERRDGENASLSVRNEALARENDQHDGRIAALSANLHHAKSELAQAQAMRNLLREESEDLKRQLQSSSERLTAMNDELRALAQAKAELAKSKQSELAAVNAQLTGMDAQLADRADELTELTQERDLLEELVASLRQRLESVEGELNNADQRLAAASQEKTQLDETVALLRQALAKSEKTLETTTQQVQSASQSERLLTLEVAVLQSQLKTALDRAAEAEKQLKVQASEGRGLHRKLVGVQGPLRRVAVLVDASGSMVEAPGRWEGVQEIVTTWLDHLDVEECVLILFSAGAVSHPSDGSLLSLQGPSGERNRAWLAERLAGHTPGGWTNTQAALEAAYAHREIDTIFLFTDGRPASPRAAFDRSAIESIYALCAKHRHIPINTIGVGDYFADPEFSAFLRKLADTTGGTFLGR